MPRQRAVGVDAEGNLREVTVAGRVWVSRETADLAKEFGWRIISERGDHDGLVVIERAMPRRF